MRGSVPYVLKLASKFCLEIAPAALAVVIGAFLFAQWHAQPAPSTTPQAAAESVLPPDRLAAMVQEEHTLLVDYLKHDRPGAKPAADASDPSPPAPAKPALAARDTPKIRKPATAESRPLVAVAPPPMRNLAPSVVADVAPPAADKGEKAPIPPLDVGPAAVQPAADQQTGFFGSVLNKAVQIKDKAVELSRVREAIGFVRDIPGRLMPGSERPSDAPAPSPAGRFTEAS